MLNPTRLIKLPLKKKIPYNIVRKSLINFKWRLVGKPMLKKVIDIKTKPHWLFKFQSKKYAKKVENFQFFLRQLSLLCVLILHNRVETAHALRKILADFSVGSDFFNWMESGLWLKLIENITVEVPNTASISKDILFHVSEFLEKIVFQLMFEIIKWIRQFQTVPNCWCRIRQIFSTRTRVLVLKQKFLYLLDFDQRTSFITNFKVLEQRCCLNLSETRRQLKFSKSFIPMWLLWQYLETAGDSI